MSIYFNQYSKEYEVYGLAYFVGNFKTYKEAAIRAGFKNA